MSLIFVASKNAGSSHPALVPASAEPLGRLYQQFLGLVVGHLRDVLFFLPRQRDEASEIKSVCF